MHSRLSRWCAALSPVLLAASCSGSPASPTPTPIAAESGPLLTFDSKLGDEIGKGQSLRFDRSNATFAAVSNQNAVSVEIRESSGTRWRLQLAAAPGTTLARGTYEVKEPIAPGHGTGPYLEFSGNGFGCTPVGRFTVHEARFGTGSAISRFHATFEQRCPSSAQGLSGEVLITESGPSEQPVADIAGTWSGRLESDDGMMLAQVVVEQAGSRITGTWSAPGTNWGGSIEGTVTSGALTGTVTFSGLYPRYQGQQCTGSAGLTAFFDGGLTQLVLQSQRFYGSCQWMPWSLHWVLQQRR